jgi:indoleamine 2,3-dioxygenase
MLKPDLLTTYQIDPARGFLPAVDPLERLPAFFESWERLASLLPALLLAHQLRPALEQLSPLAVNRLEDDRQRRRAMLLLSVLGHAYVWGEARPARVLPRGIAVPWWQVAETLGRPPIASHASIVLYNWRLLDKDGPLTLNNLASLQSFLGGLDEAWFYLVTVAIEAQGAPALPAMVVAQAAAAAGDLAGVVRQLELIAAVLAEMHALLLRMPEKCDPYIFYHRIRPFLAGWEAPGLIYEGVSETPQQFAGGSAAQSSLLQALDAGLGIVHHDDETRPFLLEMRRYMPPPHRQFIESLEAGPSLRHIILTQRDHHPALYERYNDCVQRLDQFRKAHLEIAVRYILHQTPDREAVKGTGGTSFVPFLSQARRETREGLI